MFFLGNDSRPKSQSILCPKVNFQVEYLPLCKRVEKCRRVENFYVNIIKMWLKFIKNFIKLTQINAEQEFRSSFIVVPHPFPCKSISIFSSSCTSIRQSVGNGKLQCHLLRNHSKYWHKSKMDLSRQVSRM